jgi:hypothetical protein
MQITLERHPSHALLPRLNRAKPTPRSLGAEGRESTVHALRNAVLSLFDVYRF